MTLRDFNDIAVPASTLGLLTSGRLTPHELMLLDVLRGLADPKTGIGWTSAGQLRLMVRGIGEDRMKRILKSLQTKRMIFRIPDGNRVVYRYWVHGFAINDPSKDLHEQELRWTDLTKVFETKKLGDGAFTSEPPTFEEAF